MSSLRLAQSISSEDRAFIFSEIEDTDSEDLSFISFEERGITSSSSLHLNPLLSSFSYESELESSDELPTLQREHANHPKLNRNPKSNLIFDFSLIEQFGNRPYNKSTRILTDGYCREHPKYVISGICTIIHQYTQYEAMENTMKQYIFYLSRIAQQESDAKIKYNSYFSGKYLIAKLSSYFIHQNKEEIIAICTRLLMDDYIEPDIYATGICRRNAFNTFYPRSQFKLDVRKSNTLCNKYTNYKQSKRTDDCVSNIL